jgi:hypothetical protein
LLREQDREETELSFSWALDALAIMAASTPSPRDTGFPAEGRCSYYVEKKKRFCRMVVAAGKRFCGEHAGAAEVWYRPPFPTVGNKVPGRRVLDPGPSPL